MEETQSDFFQKLMKETLSSEEKCAKIVAFRHLHPEDALIDFEKYFYCYFD